MTSRTGIVAVIPKIIPYFLTKFTLYNFSPFFLDNRKFFLIREIYKLKSGGLWEIIVGRKNLKSSDITKFKIRFFSGWLKIIKNVKNLFGEVCAYFTNNKKR
jgi:hypothetical protein